MSRNWFYYRLYRKAFQRAYWSDPKNPIAMTMAGCDQLLTQHPKVKRSPLIDVSSQQVQNQIQDTFSMAMKIINGGSFAN